MATRLNAQFVKASFGDLCKEAVVTDPTVAEEFNGRILVAAGWKPGFSTDNDAVLLAEKFNADTVVNLSNIEKVYTDDPRKNPDAKPLNEISWTDFRKMVGDEWIPGKNCPFDQKSTGNGTQSNLRGRKKHRKHAGDSRRPGICRNYDLLNKRIFLNTEKCKNKRRRGSASLHHAAGIHFERASATVYSSGRFPLGACFCFLQRI